jgi:predicted Zn-dependent protease
MNTETAERLESADGRFTEELAVMALSAGAAIGESAGISKDSQVALYARATGEYENKHYDACIRTIQMLIVLNHHKADYWRLLGNCFKAKSDADNALTAWLLSLECEPQIETCVAIARLTIGVKKFEVAQKALDAAALMASDDPSMKRILSALQAQIDKQTT